MARKNQHLINYHTSGKTTMPNGAEVHYGEIVVRHNAEKPELLVKIGENAFGVFEASGAVIERINSAVTIASNSLSTEISNLETALNEHVSAFTSYTETAAETFATKAELETAKSALTEGYTKAVADAKAEVYTSATTFTTTEVSTAKNELTQSINGVKSDLDVLSGAVANITTDIDSNYVTKKSLEEALETVAENLSDAKDEVYASANTYTDAEIVKAKGYTDDEIVKAKNELNNTIATTNSNLATLSGKVVSDYATKAELEAATEQIGSDIDAAKASVYSSAVTYTNNAKADVYTSATTYTDNKVETLSNTLTGLINGVSSDVDNLDTKVNTISGYVTTTYATKAEVEAEVEEIGKNIEAAKNAAIGAASAYTDQQITGVANKYTDDEIAKVNGTINGLSSKVDTLSAGTESAISALTEDLTELINTQVATAYRYMGSCTWEELQSKETSNGAVYNVTNLVQLENGEVYQPGTNFAWSEDEQKWEALGGSVDLSPYATTEYVDGKITIASNSVATLESKVSELSAATKTLSGDVVTYVDTTFLTKNTFATEKANIESAYTEAINTAKNAAIGAASAYTDQQVTSAASVINNTIATTNANVATLSAATETIKATANSAVQTASIVDDCGVTVEKVGTELKFDFSNMIIDCGDF
jgi:hypothetical protein